MSNEGTLFAFLAVWSFIFFLFLAIGILLYIFTSMGLYKLASNQKLENPWLSWIPVANMYILGKLIKNLKLDTLEIPSIELILSLGFFAVLILRFIPLFGWIIGAAYTVLCILALYKLFKIYRPDQAVLWIILSIVLPFMGPIFIFIIRNDSPVSQ
ncbi:hypothetical protein [Candidatus Clostridium stratigraminis]|uniref:Tripartite tricarboxylate transporter TctB family protein n=1 Tax=Candidatus Clostridium stratigraminis TaxID=3381661 RepID=A0ABW8T1S2_9CLOT